MTNKVAKSSGFVFQAIPLEDAVRMSRAGNGVYSELKEMLLETLPKLDQADGERQAFTFGLPNKQEVAKEDRKPITMTVNKCLRQAGLSWNVGYNEKHKLFFCTPSDVLVSAQTYAITRTPRAPKETPEETKKYLDALLLKASEIFSTPKSDFLGLKPSKPFPQRTALVKLASEKGIHTRQIAGFLEASYSAIYSLLKRDLSGAQLEINALKKAMGGYKS